MEYSFAPIGYVRGGRAGAVDDDWGAVEAVIALDGSRFGAEALAGLDAFSHLDVVFVFHALGDEPVASGARHPRGRSDWPAVGIFAQRAKARPNPIGLSTCEIVGVRGLSVVVRGLDAIDGTPVLDMKPHMTEFGPRGTVREPAWARELMAGYWKRP